jgi:hypothetical protein
MKRHQVRIGLVAVALLVASDSALAQFSGYFSGYYAPAHWASRKYNNAAYQNTASVNTSYTPGSLVIDGAVDALRQVSTAQPPVSIIDYSIVLSGTGLEPVAFNYLFSGLADGYDSAEFLYYNSSGLQVAVNLSGVVGVEQTFSTEALAGQTIDFRVDSNNDNVADNLTICAVPEPSTLTFLGLGVGALWWKLRRRRS